MANYTSLTTAQQAAIDAYVSAQAPVVGQLSQFLNLLNAVDTQYLSVASAALNLLVSSEYTLANLAATLATSSAPIITSATHNFTADEVGNLFVVTAGTSWILGTYKGIALSGNGMILDRACGIAATLSSGTMNVLAMVPNKVGLAGAQPTLSRDDIVSIAAHIEVALALNDNTHRQLWVKACGPTNL